MGFGYLLLAVKSEQDNYLIGNPQFTFFKAVYRKHTNFAMDYQFINFLGDTTNAFGRKLYVDIPKNGDLLHRMYLTIDITNTDVKKIAPLAYNFIEYIDILIGGQRIDRHYGEWFAIWHELMEDSSKSIALANMVGVQNNNTTCKTLTIPLRFWFNNDIGLALPLIALQYNDIKLEIKYNDKSELDKFTNLVPASTLKITNIQLIAEYIHLDKEERRLFSSTNHEYLITQVQESLNNSINNFSAKYGIIVGGVTSVSKKDFERQRHKIDLRFTYPVKELFWTIQDVVGNMNSGNEYNNTGAFKYNYWNNYESGNDQMSMCNLILNGKDLTDELPANFYRDIQQYQYHNGYGINFIKGCNGTYPIEVTMTTTTARVFTEGWTVTQGAAVGKVKADVTTDTTVVVVVTSGTFVQGNIDFDSGTMVNITNITNDINIDFAKGTGVYSYSFALNPKDFQPSGSLNFSKLESCQLKIGLIKATNPPLPNTVNKTINIYAVNYNVLRIMSGMAGLAFIN